ADVPPGERRVREDVAGEDPGHPSRDDTDHQRDRDGAHDACLGPARIAGRCSGLSARSVRSGPRYTKASAATTTPLSLTSQPSTPVASVPMTAARTADPTGSSLRQPRATTST